MAFRLHANIVDINGCEMTFEFGELCNFIDYHNDKFCIFKHKDDDGETERTLMLVPYDNILYIENI